MQIVKIVRGIKTYIRYPIVSGSLLFSGCRKFIIGKGLQINRLGYLHLGRDVSIGRDARLLFVPEYAGKMNFYLSAVDDMLKGEHDNPSIGLILCKSKSIYF